MANKLSQIGGSMRKLLLGFLFLGFFLQINEVDATDYDSTKPAQTQTVSAAMQSIKDNFNAVDGSGGAPPTTVAVGTTVTFEGSTADTIETSLTLTDPTTSDKTITLPNATGTVAVSVTTPVTLSALGDVGLTVAKDIVVSGTGMSGGEDNVLPGADADTTITLTVSKDIVAGVGLSGGEDNVLPGADADTTLTLDLTELSTATFGSGTFTTLTFDAGATDPILTMGSNSIAITNAASVSIVGDLQLSGTGPDYTLAVTGGDTFGWHAETDLSYFKNNTDSRIYWLADSNHYLNLVPETADGRVGINQGLGNPNYNLDVTGTGNFTSTLNATTLTEGGIGVPNVNNNLSVFSATTSAQLFGIISDETGSASGTPLAVFNQAPTISSPVITNINPGDDFTLTNNSVSAFTSVNTGAIVNTLYLKAGNVGIGTTGPGALLEIGASATPLILEGLTADTVETIIGVIDPTISDKTINFPNASGTVAVSVTAPITLSALGDIGITVAKDIVAGVGLSGGEDNVLPGADADTTLTLDLTEVNSAIFGNGTFTTLAFDTGVTDPLFTFGSNSLAITNAATLTTGGNTFYWATGTDVALADGGTGVSLADPAANRIWGWDDTDNAVTQMVIGAGLTYTAATDTLTSSGGDTLDVFTVGANGDYTTIQGALTAAAAGDTILVSEGTYTEAITFADDNVTLRATGAAENTIITQAAADVVAFGTSSGCTISGFTVSITAADAATDNCITSGNDAATGTDYNIIENCIIKWTSNTAVADAPCGISVTSGDTMIRNNRITITQTQASADASGVEAIHFVNAAYTHYVYNNVIKITNATTNTAGNTDYGIYLVGGSAYIVGNTITMTNAGATNHESQCIYGPAGTAGTIWIMNNELSVICSSTGKATAIVGGTGVGTIIYIIGNHIHSTTSDADGIWLMTGRLVYATGNVITGDCAYTAVTEGYFLANSFNKAMVNGSGTKLANATEVDTWFANGFVVGADLDNNIIDDATHGSGVGVIYLGNASIDATFTGFHYYKLGDTNLQMGELVRLVDGKMYRSTKKQDPTAIGLYCGLTNWKDSLGNALIDGKEENKEYEEIDADEKVIKKIKKVKNYGKEVNVKTNQPAQLIDYASSVAVVGDSIHENMNNPLMGAWVTVDAGTIKNGDYLCSSTKAGYLEKQSDDVMHSYTIGKARQDINTDTKTAYIYLLQ